VAKLGERVNFGQLLEAGSLVGGEHDAAGGAAGSRDDQVVRTAFTAGTSHVSH
jgi:hypothetical protein